MEVQDSNQKDQFKLAAFDFDHTIIDVNSDIYIDKLIIDKNSSLKRFQYPDEIEELSKTHNWTARMNGVLQHMNKSYSIRKNDIVSCLKEIKIEESMINLIKLLKEKSYELIILSDANTIFIEEILKHNGLLNLFDKVYTNKAEFSAENECLQVQPFNELFNSNKELFNCKTQICSTNICKGIVLNHHLSNVNKNKYSLDNKHIIYVGDGHNDYCPGLNLNDNDFYFVRNNFSLSKLLAKRTDLIDKIKGKIFYWTNASDIINNLA